MADPVQPEVINTPAPAAPEVTPAVETTTEQTLSPRLTRLKEEFGFEDVRDEGEAFDRLLSYTQNLKNDFSSQLQSALAELKQSAQPTTAPPATTQDAKAGWTWAPPAVDLQLVSQYRTADGWKEGTPVEIRQGFEARQRYFDNFAQKLVSDPAGALDPLLEEKFNAFFEQRFGQVAAQQQEVAFQQQVYSENSWLWEPDPVTKQPVVGRLSAEGQALNQHFIEAQQDGHSFAQAWKYALACHRAAKAEQAARTTTQAKTAEEINAQKKADLLRRAAPGLNRSGSLPTPAEPRSTQQNRRLSAGERLLQNAQRNGVAVH